jgi:hypothetical protein
VNRYGERDQSVVASAACARRWWLRVDLKEGQMGEQKRVASTKIIYHASAEAAREGRNRVKLLYLDQQTITRVAIATWLQRIQRRFDIESGDYDIAKLETKIGLKHVDLLLMNIGVESAEPLNSLPALARLFPTVPIVLITARTIQI